MLRGKEQLDRILDMFCEHGVFIDPDRLDLIFSVFPHLLAAKVNEDENTFLHTAAMEGEDKAVNFFLAKGINANVRNKDGSAPLHFAAATPSWKLWKRF